MTETDEEYMEFIGRQIDEAAGSAHFSGAYNYWEAINKAWGEWDLETLVDTRAITRAQANKIAEMRERDTEKTEHERMRDFFFPKRRGTYLMSLKSWR